MTNARLELNAEPRIVLGKKVAVLRRKGLTPANIFGHNIASVSVQVPTAEAHHTLRAAGRTHLIQLSLQGEATPRMVLIRNIARKATTDELLHIDFYQVLLTEKTNADVPLVIVGKAPVLDRIEGVLVQSLSALHVECLPQDIPDRIEVDVSSLTDTHSMIHVSDLPIPSNITVLDEGTTVVAGISMSAAAAAEAAEAAEAAAEPVVEEAAEAPAESKEAQ